MTEFKHSFNFTDNTTISMRTDADIAGEFLIRFNDFDSRVYADYFKIIGETKHGYWIDYFPNPNGKKFVLKKSFKKFACTTHAEALKSFEARKNRQIKILRAQLERVEASLKVAINKKEEIKRRALEPLKRIEHNA